MYGNKHMIIKYIFCLILIDMMQYDVVIAARYCRHHRKKINSCMSLFRNELSKYQKTQETIKISSLIKLAGQIPTLCRQYRQMIICLNNVIEKCNTRGRKMQKIQRDMVILKNHMASYICNDSLARERKDAVATVSPTPQDEGRSIANRLFSTRLSSRKLELFWMKFQRAKGSQADRTRRNERKDTTKKKGRRKKGRKNRRKKNKRTTVPPATTTTANEGKIIFEQGGLLLGSAPEELPYYRDLTTTTSTFKENTTQKISSALTINNKKASSTQITPHNNYSIVHISTKQNNSKSFQLPVVDIDIDENKSSNFSSKEDDKIKPIGLPKPTEKLDTTRVSSIFPLKTTPTTSKEVKETLVEEILIVKIDEDTNCQETQSSDCKSSKHNSQSSSAHHQTNNVVITSLFIFFILELFR